MVGVTYESKENASHTFWVARYGRYAIRIEQRLFPPSATCVDTLGPRTPRPPGHDHLAQRTCPG
jgi:hypothetical protein